MCHVKKSTIAGLVYHAGFLLQDKMNSTEVQNPRRKMQVALFAEPKTPLESSMSIIIL